MKELIRLNLQRIFFIPNETTSGMSKQPSKQITLRFDLKDWIHILQEAEGEGIKPVQFIRSTMLKRLNGTLVDVRGIDAYIKQRDRDDMLGNRRQL
jgi:hypothetical protein